MDRFKNKYRIGSARLAGYDYGQNGAYFITICTANREPYFGKVLNNKMQLNQLGELAQKYWMEIPQQFSFAKLDEFVIMPNHMHGILMIDKPAINDKTTINRKTAINRRNAINRVSTINNHRVSTNDNNCDSIQNNHRVSTINNNRGSTTTNNDHRGSTDKNQGGFAGDKNPMFHENISRIIRWYKGRCTFEMRKLQPDFAWQGRFYEHIIRHRKAFYRIVNYIVQNPAQWETDRFNAT